MSKRCACAHMHAHTHTHTHTHTHAHTHTQQHTQQHTHIHARARAHTAATTPWYVHSPHGYVRGAWDCPDIHNLVQMERWAAAAGAHGRVWRARCLRARGAAPGSPSVPPAAGGARPAHAVAWGAGPSRRCRRPSPPQPPPLAAAAAAAAAADDDADANAAAAADAAPRRRMGLFELRVVVLTRPLTSSFYSSGRRFHKRFTSVPRELHLWDMLLKHMQVIPGARGCGL